MVFSEKVLQVVKTIPKGSTLTYKQVAIAVGSPRSYRAVASVLSKNANKKIPCHRVIKSDGSLGGYNGLLGKSKESLLNRESLG